MGIAPGGEEGEWEGWVLSSGAYRLGERAVVYLLAARYAGLGRQRDGLAVALLCSAH